MIIALIIARMPSMASFTRISAPNQMTPRHYDEPKGPKASIQLRKCEICRAKTTYLRSTALPHQATQDVKKCKAFMSKIKIMKAEQTGTAE